MRDGGPAFPSEWHPVKDGYKRGDCGMSLRDYFAAQVLGAYVSKLPIKVNRDPNLVLQNIEDRTAMEHGDEILRAVAEVSYRYADAMLTERGKEKE